MKVAVVGNGETAVKKRNGSFIDSCDRVVRINKFVIDGYEEYVGEKLDIYCAKWHKIYHRDKDFLHQHNEFWFPHPEPPTMWGALGGHLIIDDEIHKENINRFGINDKRIRFLDDSTRALLDETFDNNEPSIGVVAIEMAQYYFPEAEIYITGFDGMQSGWYWDSSHNCMKDCRNSIIHEKIYFSRYEKNKLDR